MDAPQPADLGIDPVVSRRIFFGLLALMLGAAAATTWLRPKPTPPPAEIAHDRTLVAGREIYLARCVSCHGPDGHGDGPLAKGLSGPPPRDFVDGEFKHGRRPEQVLAVIAKGVPGTAMGGWASSYPDDELKAVTAYVLHLAKPAK